MRILSIESSCDETAAAIVNDGVTILSSVVATSLEIHKKYGGIVPEIASRKQAEYMIPVLQETFEKAGVDRSTIDAIAVTIGPGLIGSLLVGVDTARTLSLLWNKPLIPVNHLVGHIYSGWLFDRNLQLVTRNSTAKQKSQITNYELRITIHELPITNYQLPVIDSSPQFPLIALIASGGHTDLVLVKGHGDLTLLGSTRDDAVGEAFDKVARLLNLPYPGGPEIEKCAKNGDPQAVEFPRPMIDSPDFEFSYSGLKTSVRYEIERQTKNGTLNTADIAASFQQAAFDVLVTKTLRAVTKHNAQSLLITGGVAANQRLKEMFITSTREKFPDLTVCIPPLSLATDNATYIATAGYFLYDQLSLDPIKDRAKILSLRANPGLEVTDL